jgi:hypothetical protein
MQHRRQRAADRARQRERGQRVHGVVAAADVQRIDWHQLVDEYLAVHARQLGGRLAPAMAHRQILGPGQPGDAAIAHQPVFVGLRGCVHAEADRMRRRALAALGLLAGDALGLGNPFGHRALFVGRRCIDAIGCGNVLAGGRCLCDGR